MQALKAYNAVDFDDLILQPVLLFREYRDVLQKW
jgi:ATP-dependent DNA helicase Rep